MTWQFLLYLSVGTVDLCAYSGKSLVREKSITIEDGGFDKDLKPTRGTASWEVGYSPALLAELLAQTTRPKVEIKKDGAFVHTGLLRPTDDYSFSNELDFFPMESVDFSDLLDQRTGVALSLAGVVSRAAGGSDSIVHRLAALLTTSVTVIAEDNLTALANFSCAIDEEIGPILSTILAENRMTMRFDEQGRLVVKNLPAATAAATFGDHAGQLDIDNKTLKMKRLDSVEDSVELEFLQFGQEVQAIRYNNGSSGWALGASYNIQITLLLDEIPTNRAKLLAQRNWKITGTVEGEWQIYLQGSFHDRRSFSTYPGEPTFSGGTTIVCIGFSFESNQVVLTLMSNTLLSGWLPGTKITSLTITADYDYVFPRPTKMKSVGPKSIYKKLESRFIFDATTAQTYADLLKSRLGGGGYVWSWNSSSKREVGEVVGISVSRDGVSGLALITGRKWARASLKYEYDGIKYSTVAINTTTIPDVDVSNPIVYQIESNVPSINRRTDGSLVPSSVTFNLSQSQSPGGVALYLGTIKIYETSDGTNWNLVSTSPASVSSASWVPYLTAKAVKAQLWTDGGQWVRDCFVSIIADGVAGPIGTSGVSPFNNDLSFRLPLADMPELPDNTAGVLFRQIGFSAANISAPPTTTSYSARRNDATWQGSPYLTIVNGSLCLDNSSNTITILRLQAGGIGSASAFRYIRLMSTVDKLLTFNMDGTSITKQVYANRWDTLAMKFDGTGGNVIDIETLPVGFLYIAADYIGDGSYAPKSIIWSNPFDQASDIAGYPLSASGGTAPTASVTNGSLAVTGGTGSEPRVTIPGSVSIAGAKLGRALVRRNSSTIYSFAIAVYSPGYVNIGANEPLPAVGEWAIVTFTIPSTVTIISNLPFGFGTGNYDVAWFDVSDGIYGALQDTSVGALKLSVPAGVVRVPGPRTVGFFSQLSLGPFVTNNNLGLSGASFTLSRWIKWSGAPSKDNFFVVLSAFATRQCLHLGMRTATKTLRLGFYGDDLDGSTTLSQDVWYHVAATFNKNTLDRKIYLNGELEAQGTAGGVLSLTSASSVFCLAGVNDNGEGFSSETRVDLLEFSAAEVLGLYAQTPAPDAKATEVAVVQKAPKYLGSFAVPPRSANPGDSILQTAFPTANECAVQRWSGTAWEVTTDSGLQHGAGSGIVAWCSANAAHTPPTGWYFLENLAVVKIFTDALRANTAFISELLGVNAEFKGRLTAAYGRLGGIASDTFVPVSSSYPFVFPSATAKSVVWAFLVTTLGIPTTVDAYYGASGIISAGPMASIRWNLSLSRFEIIRDDGIGLSITNIASVIGTDLTFDRVWRQATISSDLVPANDGINPDIGTALRSFRNIYASKFFGSQATLTNLILRTVDILVFGGGGGGTKYIKLAEGYAIQWGETTVMANSTTGQSVALPLAFTELTYIVQVIGTATRGGAAEANTTVPVRNYTNFSIAHGYATSQTIMWFAFGKWN